MRIAFAIIDCNRRDGHARPVLEVSERLAASGHDVHIFSRTLEDIGPGIATWHRIPGPGWPDVANFVTYYFLANRRLRSPGFDIVHSIGCNTACANVVSIQTIQPAKHRILSRMGKASRVSAPRRLTRWLFHLCTSAAERQLYTRDARSAPLLFLPVSRGVESELREHYHIGESAVRIIPNAADTEVFKPLCQTRRSEWRAGNGFHDADFLVMFSGGEWARKGLDLAIRAMSLLVHQPGVNLFVAGDDPDRARFFRLADELGVATNVRFGGFRKDVAEAMAASDVFLFPSYYEAFSLATIEAAACGLPVVASTINGAEDFVRSGWNGEFVTHDPVAIARAVETLLADPGHLATMGRNARLLVERDYTWDRVATLTETAYLEFLGAVNNRRGFNK